MNPARILYHPATLIGLVCLILFALGGIAPKGNSIAPTAPVTQQPTATQSATTNATAAPATNTPAPTTQTNPYTVPPPRGDGGEGGFDD